MKTVKLIILTAMCIVAAWGAKAQIITTFAGTTGGYSGDGGPATMAQLRIAIGIVKDTAGNLYFSENTNHIVRKVNKLGLISTIAGTGVAGNSGDGGPATLAQLTNPGGVAVDKMGNVYVTTPFSAVKKIDASGVISNFAGNGTTVFSGDGGPASLAGLGSGVTSMCMDDAGNLYMAGSYRIRKVTSAGIISTIAGTGVGGYSGDGGMADTAKISYVDQVMIDGYGNIYFTDGAKGLIRQINTSGIISTVAGNGVNGYSGDFGMATAAQLNVPHGVYADSCGLIYIADYGNHRIRVVDEGGKIYTIAGTGVAGLSGDGGAATAAQLNKPYNLLLDKNNDLYIGDTYNGRIRKVALPRCDSMVFPVMVADVAATDAAIEVLPTEGNGAIVVRVNGTGRSHVAIVTMQGTVMREYELIRGITTPLEPQLLPGMYLVLVQTEAGRVTKKVVVR
jgi:hypothetical protein